MIKSFIFDIGNVLLPFDFAVAMRKLALNCENFSEAHIAAHEPIKLAYESGHIGRDEFLDRARKALNYTASEAWFLAAWEDIFSENVAMTEIVRALHQRYPLYLLSNTSDIHVDHIFRSYPAFRLFRDAVYSYRVKVMKPDPAIYEIAIRQFGVEPAETFFIDDLSHNIETARQLGFQVFHYDYRNHAALLEALENAGVVLG